jgi:hypothetical protein
MNILIERLPDAVEIDGREYLLNTDFRTCLRVILAFEDPELTNAEKQMVMLNNIYPEMPENIQAALDQANKFLNGGNVEKSEEEGVFLPRLYSFSKDANFIFAAFKQTHDIDLSTEQLHWWKFIALFMDLGGETTFSNLIQLRKKVFTGTATKEEKQAASDMGEIFDIPQPDTRTLEEKKAEAIFMAQVKNG